MRTIEDKNIPSRGVSGFNQVLIQVQLIQSLPFVTTMKNKNTTTKKNKKIPYPFFNTGCSLRASHVIRNVNEEGLGRGRLGPRPFLSCLERLRDSAGQECMYGALKLSYILRQITVENSSFYLSFSRKSRVIS